VRSGQARATKAFTTLHEQGWAMAEAHYSFQRMATLRAARPLLDASAAFARIAAGATAEDTLAAAWGRFILQVEDPHELLRQLPPPTKWACPAGPYSEMTEALAIVHRFLNRGDLDAAEELLDQVDSRPDLAGPHDRAQVQEFRTEVARRQAAAGAPKSLPWDQMAASVVAGEVGRKEMEELSASDDAPGQYLRACATRLGQIPTWRLFTSGMDFTDEAWRWLDPLLEDPIPLDAGSSRARVDLAVFVLVKEPRDLSSRLPGPELATVVNKLAPRFLNNSIGVPDFAKNIRRVDSWLLDCRGDRLALATRLRFSAAAALCRSPVLPRPVMVVTFQSLPELLQRWLGAALQREVPDDDIRALARAAVRYWPRNVDDLVRFAASICTELQDLGEPADDEDDEEFLDDDDSDPGGNRTPEPQTQGSVREGPAARGRRLDPAKPGSGR
jgi:hypothetical protein